MFTPFGGKITNPAYISFGLGLVLALAPAFVYFFSLNVIGSLLPWP